MVHGIEQGVPVFPLFGRGRTVVDAERLALVVGKPEAFPVGIDELRILGVAQQSGHFRHFDQRLGSRLPIEQADVALYIQRIVLPVKGVIVACLLAGRASGYDENVLFPVLAQAEDLPVDVPDQQCSPLVLVEMGGLFDPI